MTLRVIWLCLERYFVRCSATHAGLRQIEDCQHWHCGDAEYRHVYDRSVTRYVQSGAATVNFQDGSCAELDTGDLLTIRKGANGVWRISQAIQNRNKYHD